LGKLNQLPQTNLKEEDRKGWDQEPQLTHSTLVQNHQRDLQAVKLPNAFVDAVSKKSYRKKEREREKGVKLSRSPECT
jgi:hypothetical protein